MANDTFPELDFLIIGAEKSGTTWLYQNLAKHPDIFLPETKEVHFFNEYNSYGTKLDNYTKRSPSWYGQFFATRAQEKVAGEVTPMYLCDPIASTRIAETYPNIKIIAILRNPVDRALSHYWMARNKAQTKEDIETALLSPDSTFINRSMYGAQLSRYYAIFPRSSILVLKHEALFESPRKGLNSILDFLGIDAQQLAGIDNNALQAAVFKSSAYRSAFLDRHGSIAARWLRKHTITNHLANILKSSGLFSYIKRKNSVPFSYEPLSPEFRLEAFSLFEQDLQKLADLLGPEFEVWNE